MFISSEISVVLTLGSPKSLNRRSERSRMRSRVRRGGLRSMDIFAGAGRTGAPGVDCGKNTAAGRRAALRRGSRVTDPALEVVERVRQQPRGCGARGVAPGAAALLQALHQRQRFVAQHVGADLDSVACEQRRELMAPFPQFLARLLVSV